MFFNFFRNARFNDFSIRKNGFDYKIEVPFHAEEIDSDENLPK